MLRRGVRAGTMLLRVRHAWQLAGRRLAARALSAGAAGSAAVVFAAGRAGLCAPGMECTLSHVPRVTRLFIESG